MCSLIALAGLFTAASASATSYPNYTLFKLSPDNAFNARSLDGSPAAFYFLPGSGENANDWILYFQGGGWCYNIDDCYGRSLGHLGSSSRLAPSTSSRPLGGLMSTDCTISPLCNYTKVWFSYTDGNSFSGMLDAPVPYTTPNGTVVDIWFRGRANIDGIIDAVSRNVMGSNNLFANARHIIETGCSAGGLAAYLHADYLFDKLAGKYTGQYLSMPISGYFLDAVSQSGVKQYGKQIAVIHALSNASTNAACEAFYTPTADTWRCNMAEYVYPFIKPPVFVLNSMYDAWQTMCIMTSEPVWNETESHSNGNCSAVAGWSACADNSAACTPAQIQTGYLPFGEEMITSITATNAVKSSAPGSGGFITSCHTHCEAQDTRFDWFAIGKPSMRDAASAWITSNQASKGMAPPQWLTDCTYTLNAPYQCNPTCNITHTAAAFAG